MSKCDCPYEKGKHEICWGCKHFQGEMSFEEFVEICGLNITCADCKWFKANADIKGVISTCKRLDHKKIQFSRGPFASYNCGSGNGTSYCICNDFELQTTYKQLENHWQESWKYKVLDMFKGTVGLCIDGNKSIRYEVKCEDFKNNTFINEDGSLKWIRKQYFKRNNKSPIGYIFINEYPDGFIQEKANQKILWEHIGGK